MQLLDLFYFNYENYEMCFFYVFDFGIKIPFIFGGDGAGGVCMKYKMSERTVINIIKTSIRQINVMCCDFVTSCVSITL